MDSDDELWKRFNKLKQPSPSSSSSPAQSRSSNTTGTSESDLWERFAKLRPQTSVSQHKSTNPLGFTKHRSEAEQVATLLTQAKEEAALTFKEDMRETASLTELSERYSAFRGEKSDASAPSSALKDLFPTPPRTSSSFPFLPDDCEDEVSEDVLIARIIQVIIDTQFHLILKEAKDSIRLDEMQERSSSENNEGEGKKGDENLT